jgi:DNA-binding HxlR family transcriptional regulator
MQSSKLWIPKVVLNLKNSEDGRSGISSFLQHEGKNQDQIPVFTNDNRESSQLLKYCADHGNNDNDGDGASHISVNDLRNNDKNVVSLLNEEMGATYSFKALERKLDIHQQSLTRALKRLKYLNLIEKTPAGYIITKNKNTFLTKEILKINQLQEEATAESELSNETKKKSRKRFNQLIQISIPIRNNIELIINQLVGKWFGNLRWFGLVKKETGVTLQWVAINKYNNNNKLFQINVNIVSEYVVIESNAVSDKEKVEAMSCSNRIVGEIIRTLQINLKEEYEIPDEFASPSDYVPNYLNKAKYNYKKNN